MHLVSLAEQTVTIPKADLAVKFQPNETIWTESSHKYNLPEIIQLARQAGFRCEKHWVDEEWAFADNLFVAE